MTDTAENEGSEEGDNSKKISVLVTGDIVIDHHIYEGNRHHFGDVSNNGVVTIQQLGGAAILASLLDHLGNAPKELSWATYPREKTLNKALKDVLEDALNRRFPDFKGDHADDKGEQPEEGKPEVQNAYAFWRPQPEGGSKEKQIWRVAEAMGFGRSSKPKKDASCEILSSILSSIGERPPSEPGVIVISEGGMGFRENKNCWKNLDFNSADHIVLKTAAPLAEGALWEKLTSENKNKLTVVISADELRKSSARISSGLSWDETLEDTLRELRPDGALATLAECKYLIIAFGSEGAIWFDVSSKTVHFVYEAGSIEHEHAYHTEGTAFGFLTCLTASVVRILLLEKASPAIQFNEALAAGLSAMQDLRSKGHGPAAKSPVGFPAKDVANYIIYPSVNFTRTIIPLETDLSKFSILKTVLLRHSIGQPAYAMAELTAIYGSAALVNLPHLQVGDLFTADRDEIEPLRILTQVIRQYEDHDKGKTPLSIGVFGPPGAGKSFAVKELADNLLGDDKSWLEFNLSQFSRPEDLIGAFHQIRDEVLKGKRPVAFFDEFDSQNYRWLQYLLAPMQDGRFQQGNLTHTIGKAIFVFAGGTSWTFETFGPPDRLEGSKIEDARKIELKEGHSEFRLAKGPDFKSRLDAFLNVLGPNRKYASPPPAAGAVNTNKIKEVSLHLFGPDHSDICFPIRRSLMMRSMLKCGNAKMLKIEEGLLNAILKGPQYTHGARSLAKILKRLKNNSEGSLQPSQLPPKHQLAMHTNDSKAFLHFLTNDLPKRTKIVELKPSQIDIIAPAIHETWRSIGKTIGYLKAKDDVDLCKFENGTDSEKFKAASNSNAAERIPHNLALVGLYLSDDESTQEQWDQVNGRLECYLELLAMAEHEGWMNYYIQGGWTYAKERDDDNKKHNCLLPYLDLSETEKNKDRASIRQYPEFAKRAGMKIVGMESEKK